ncbi:DsbA family protein [Pseudomonas sp. zjy_13]|uniref:DsbA family protein n=1 Tax=Pseudomonas sp. zjy_13 TaxID=3367263 RepID=UPI00370BC8CD
MRNIPFVAETSFIFALMGLGFGAWSSLQVVKLQEALSASTDEQTFDQRVLESSDRNQQKKYAAEASRNLQGWQSASAEIREDRAKIYGNSDARFSIVEYSDMECPYCRNFHGTPKYLVDSSKGKVNWQWKHLPLSFHEPAATEAALASECVYDQKGSQGFWAFTEQWFKVSQGNGKGASRPVSEIAASSGAESKRFDECMLSRSHQPLVDAQKGYGARIGITGTPASMIVDNHNGRRVFVKGGAPVGAIASAINELAQSSTDVQNPAKETQFELDRQAVRLALSPPALPAKQDTTSE